MRLTRRKFKLLLEKYLFEQEEEEEADLEGEEEATGEEGEETPDEEPEEATDEPAKDDNLELSPIKVAVRDASGRLKGHVNITNPDKKQIIADIERGDRKVRIDNPKDYQYVLPGALNIAQQTSPKDNLEARRLINSWINATLSTGNIKDPGIKTNVDSRKLLDLFDKTFGEE